MDWRNYRSTTLFYRVFRVFDDSSFRILAASWGAGAGQFLDSLAIDGAANICCASPGKGDILVFPPEGGVPHAIQVDDFLPTNIAFGGPDMSVAYITLASSGRLVAGGLRGGAGFQFRRFRACRARMGAGNN